MSPSILIVVALLFLFSTALHVILWRWRRPQQQIGWFLIIFLTPLPLLALAGVRLLPYLSLQDFLFIALAHLALSCAYIQIYPACQALSPSLMVLLFVGNSMPDGMTEAEIQARFSKKILLGNRIQDLLVSGFIREGHGQFEITPRGLWIVLPGILLRKMLGLAPGKG